MTLKFSIVEERISPKSYDMDRSEWVEDLCKESNSTSSLLISATTIVSSASSSAAPSPKSCLSPVSQIPFSSNVFGWPSHAVGEIGLNSCYDPWADCQKWLVKLASIAGKRWKLELQNSLEEVIVTVFWDNSDSAFFDSSSTPSMTGNLKFWALFISACNLYL